MVSPGLYDNVKTFSVGDLIPSLSDHCPITVTIKVSLNCYVSGPNNDFIEKPKKKDIAFRFENILQSEDCKVKQNYFLESAFEVSQSSNCLFI